jgi:MYXO-CTERM domain-containing protein
MAGSALTGVTTVSGGTLVYGGAYASSTHAIASGAALEIAVASGERDSAATTFTGAGTLRKTGNGRLIWGPGTATFALGSGSLIDVRGGEFTGGSYGNENWSSNLSSLNVEDGAIFNTVEANVRLNRITGTGTIRTGYVGAGYANLTIGVDNGSGAFDGVIANADAPGNLVKVGTGAITLAGANTYTGTTTVSEGTLRAGANAAFTNKGRLVLAGSAVLDLGGFNAAFTSFDSTSANLITNSSAGTAASNATAVGTPSGAGVYVDAFTLSALDQAINAQITDGTTRKTQLIIANNNSAANLANILNGANSFSGGLVLTSTGGGTRLRINSPLSGTPLGSGPIIIGQAATDKAQILFDSATPVTLANDIVVNTALGSDNSGALRIDTTGHVLTGKVTANLAALHLANTGSLRLTGQITGANGLILERGVTVTLANTTGSANNYAGDTVINLGAANGRSATLRLGAADQIPTGANAGNVTVSSSGTGIGLLDLNGFDQRINGLSGTGLVDGNAAGGAGTNTLTVGDNNASSSFSGILRNTVGTLALTKTGNGLLSLEGDNTYDGATSVQAGILQVGLGGLSGRLGRGAVTIASGAVLKIDRSDAYGTTGGQTFAGAGTLVKEGSGDLTFWGTGAAQALVSGLQNLTVNGGVVRTDNWAQWKSDLNLTVSGAGVFELWNTTTSLGSLNGNGTVRNTANWSGYANGAAYATNNLTIASGNFSGTITDNGVGDGGNTGTSGDTRINLIKSGPGTLTLSAANTFGGTTSVNGGRLVVTHASALGAGAVTINAGTLQVDAAAPLANAITVNNGGLLGGKGSTGSVAVATGGALSPGASPGILNTGNLTLARGSIIHWQVLDGLGNAGVGYDQLMVNGMLDLTDASSTNRIILKISSINGQDQLANPLNFGAPNGVPSIRTFQFGQAGGLQLNNGVNISDLFSFDVTDFRYSDGSLSNAALWSIDWDGAGAITLTAVPEPSTYGLGLGALALAAAALRRRRRPAPQA